MALGTPVVSTAVLGTKTVLCDGRGVLIAKENEDDFSAKVLQLMRDDTARQTLSQAALDYVQDWSIGRMVERKLEVYARLLATQPNGRAAIGDSAG